MPATTVKLGPGTLTIGAVASAVDFTCQVIGARVDWSVNADDPVEVLCGETVAGDRTYTAALTGSIYQDLGDAAGIVAYSWAHKGEEVPFTFIPSTVVGDTVTGNLILDPVSVGGDDVGARMTSDFEWAIVGEPVLGAGTLIAGAAARSSKTADTAPATA